jgi:hypothetical protein
MVMKCLSLIQPWATLVVAGAKQYETRRWTTKYRGPLGIHASRTALPELVFLCLEEPFRAALEAAGYESAMHLPRGALIGTVQLLDVMPTDRLDLGQLSAAELAFGDFSPGRFAWRLAQPVLFPAPKPCTGRPGIFEV